MIGFIALAGSIFSACVLIAWRYRQSRKMGEKLAPLTSDDRLRITLALRHLEEAERELAKAAWKDNSIPGHPTIGLLLLETKELQAEMRRAFRGSF